MENSITFNDNNNLKTLPVYSISSSEEKMLMVLFMVLIACLFYSSGNFGFWNIWGIRREIQILLTLAIFPIYLVVFARFPVLVKKPLILLLFVILIFDLVFQRNIEAVFLMDRIVSIGIIGFILSSHEKYGQKILKWIIVFCCIFSIMSIIQAVIVLAQPELIEPLQVKYSSSFGAFEVEIKHPLSLLGFVIDDRVDTFFLGHQIARFGSFASEPSALVCTFLVPGILALSYRGFIRLCSIPILLFVVFLAQSGTVWLSTFLGLIAWVLFLLFSRRALLLSALPFLVAIVWYTSLPQMDLREFARSGVSLFGRLPDYYPFFRKVGSVTHRLEPFVNNLTVLKSHYLWGVPYAISSGGGFLIKIALYAGVIGLIIGTVFFSQLLKYTVYCFRQYKGSTRLMAPLLYGTIFQVLLFNSSVWNKFTGMLMLALIVSRLEFLTGKGKR